MTRKKLISKSAYLIFKQCPKYLWYYINDRDNIPAPDPDTQFYFKIGHIVGQLAKMYFSEGIDIGHENEFDKNLKRTQSLLKEGKPLFEAGFLYNDTYCDLYSRADILLPVTGKEGGGKVWDIVEVKSSTGVKDVNLYDLAFQKYCYQKSGLDIRNCNLMYINNQYCRQNDIDVKDLFAISDVTEIINKVCLHVKHDLKQIVKIINSEAAPEIDVGKLCNSPYSCPLKDRCWEGVSDSSIFYLYAITAKTARRLKECGIETMDDIPDDFSGLTYKQKMQIECEKNSEVHIDREAISEYLEKIKYPVYFLDFETFASPIPVIEKTRPYQNIPFQFSLHVLKSIDGELEHYSFLAEGDTDPRKQVLEHLKKYIGPDGSVVVYNESFEKAILRELANLYPEDGSWISSIIDRVVDLYEPFKNFNYYHTAQKGSASMKKVLPVLTGISYDDMDISNGSLASASFLNSSRLWKDYVDANKLDKIAAVDDKLQTSEEVVKMRKSLEKYCKLDTEGMVHVMQALKKFACDEIIQDKN
jgi:hypothetical protein